MLSYNIIQATIIDISKFSKKFGKSYFINKQTKIIKSCLNLGSKPLSHDLPHIVPYAVA